MASKRPRNEISIAEDLLRYKVTSTPDKNKNESDLVKAKENADTAMSRLRRSLEAKNLPAMHDKPTYDAENNRVFNYLDVPKASIDSLASSSGTSTQEFLDSLYLGTKVGGEIKDGGDDNVGNDNKPDSSTSDLKHLKYTVAASDLNSSHRKDLGLALKDEASVLDNAFTQSTGSGFQVDFYIPQEAYQEYYDAAKDAYLAKYACADLADESVQIKINKAASKNFIHDKFANTLKLQRKFRSAETREAKKAAKEKQEEQRKKLEKKYIDAQAKESIQREKLSAKQKADREKLAQQLRKFAAAKHLDLDKLPEASMEGLSENQIEARKNTLIGILGNEKGKDGIPFADVVSPYTDVLSKDQQLSLLEQLKADRYVDPEAQRRARVFTAQNGIRLDKADKFGKRTSNRIANSYFNKTGFEASDTYIEDVKQQQIKKLSEKRFKTGKYKGQLLGDILAPYTDGMSTDEQLYALNKFKGSDRGTYNGNIVKGALAVGGFGLAAFGKGLSGITKAINNGWRTFKSLTSRILGTVGVLAALGTQAVSLLRRGVLNVVNNAKETVSSFTAARELGIPLWQVQQMNDADVRRGLEKGTSTKAIAKINEIGTDVLNIDEEALGKLAPVSKDKIRSLIDSKEPYKAMEEIINAYFKLGSGKDSKYYDTVGRETTKLDSQKTLIENLNRVSPEMAALLSKLFQMNDVPSMYKLKEVTGLADYYKVNSTVEVGKNGIANRADLSVTLQYDDFNASFKELLNDFKTNFAKEVSSLIDSLKVASAAVLGKPSEVINTAKAVKETNIKTIDAANYAQAVFSHDFEKVLASTPELAGLSKEKAQQLATAVVNADGTTITPTQYSKLISAKETIVEKLKSSRSQLKGKIENEADVGKLKLSDLFTFDGKGKPNVRFLNTAIDRYEADADDILNTRLQDAFGLPMFKDLAKYKNMTLDEFFEYAGEYNNFAYAFSTDSSLRNAAISFAVSDAMLQHARKTDKAGGTLGTEDTYRQELLEQITKKLEETKYTYTTTKGTEYSSNNIATIYRAADADLSNNINDERAKKTKQFATKELINAESLFNFAHITDYLAFDKNGNMSFMDLGREEVSGKVRTTAENEKFLLGVNKKLGLIKQEKANKLTETETEELQQKLHNIAEFLNQWNAVDEKEGADIAWNNFAKATYTTDENARSDAISKFAKFSGIDENLAYLMVDYINNPSSRLSSTYDTMVRDITEASAYGASEVLGTNEVPKTLFGKVFSAVKNTILQKPLSEITTAVQRYSNAGGDSSSTLDSILKSLLLPHLNKEDVVQAASEQGVANPEDFYNSGAFLDHITIERANDTVNFYLDLNINDEYKGRLMYKDFLPDSRNSAELSLNLGSQNNVINSATQARQFSYS